MEAKLRHQSPLKWEDFEKKNAGIPDPPPLPDVSYLLSRCTTRCTQYYHKRMWHYFIADAVDDPLVKKKMRQQRRSTTYETEMTNRALQNFTGVDLLDDDDDDDYDDDETNGTDLIIIIILRL